MDLRHDKRTASHPFFIRHFETELLIAGALAVMLLLAAMRSYLPQSALITAGLLAFASIGIVGLLLHRYPNRINGAWLWASIAMLGVAWIAAGRLARPFLGN